MSLLKKVIAFPLILFIYVYRYAISPLTPASCRHYPTCSAYSMQALKMHGPLRGSWLAVKRIAACHPWGSGGIDPVPRIIVKKIKLKVKAERSRLD